MLKSMRFIKGFWTCGTKYLIFVLRTLFFIVGLMLEARRGGQRDQLETTVVDHVREKIKAEPGSDNSESNKKELMQKVLCK